MKNPTPVVKGLQANSMEIGIKKSWCVVSCGW